MNGEEEGSPNTQIGPLRHGKLPWKGTFIELHGYTHVGREFDCNADRAEEKLELGLGEFRKCGLPYPRYFIAPRYALSKDALDVLLGYNITVIGQNFIYFPNGEVEHICNREYTWYLDEGALPFRVPSGTPQRQDTCTGVSPPHGSGSRRDRSRSGDRRSLSQPLSPSTAPYRQD
ncbi:DUF2334 domain-containing protein [Thermococcus sp.]|uniref:DUF2334 domain-containing protein n=1 Tax=Thermococcus sp. TaxID=35749 RepID=UPI00263634EC|nr:DUF2334 domain-containing protein [Thermococcus sp.]